MQKLKHIFIVLSAAIILLALTGNAFADFTVEAGENFILDADETLQVDGSLTIIAGGTLDAKAAGTVIKLAGNWDNLGGTFDAGTDNTLIFEGGSTSEINGTTSFHNFTCIIPNKQLTFEESKTQTIGGTLTLNGQAAGTEIKLRSSIAGSRWNFNIDSPQGVEYVDVKDGEVTNIVNQTEDILAENSLGEPAGNNNDNVDAEPTRRWVFRGDASLNI